MFGLYKLSFKITTQFKVELHKTLIVHVEVYRRSVTKATWRSRFLAPDLSLPSTVNYVKSSKDLSSYISNILTH
jgi:hypothetical protein